MLEVKGKINYKLNLDVLTLVFAEAKGRGWVRFECVNEKGEIVFIFLILNLAPLLASKRCD